jgi:MFS family permease
VARAQDIRNLLVSRDFRALYTSRLTSQTADGVFQASLVSFVLFSPERATSAAALAGALAVVLLPFSVLGPFAGIVLDRASRQRVLVICALVRAVLLGLLVVLIAAHHTGPDFYAVAIAVVSVNRFVLAALSAGLPIVVPTGTLVTANAFSVTSGTVVTLLGAGLGTGVRSLLGGDDAAVAAVAALACAIYLGAAATAARAGRRTFGPLEPLPWEGALGQARQVTLDLVDGAQHLWSRRPARDALGALMGARVSIGLLSVMTILLYRNYFGGGHAGLGGIAVVVTASGIGLIAAAFVTPRATVRWSKPTWILTLLFVSASVVVIFGLPFSSPLFVIESLILGFTAQGVKICVDTTVQEQIADAYRGRAFSLYDLMFNVTYVCAAALGALTLPATGRSPAVVVVMGVVFLLSGLLYFRSIRHAGPVGDPAATPATELLVPASEEPKGALDAR